MSKNLDPDQAQHFVGPDLAPNCLHMNYQQKTLADKKLLVGWLVLLLYVPSQQLWSLRDGQFT